MLHNSEKDFIKRHIGLSKKDEKTILSDLGYKSLNELIEDTAVSYTHLTLPTKRIV